MHSSAACASPATVKACTYATTAIGNVPSPFGDVQLYPNPNEGIFTITGTIAGSKSLNIEVMNAVGQVVYKDAATITGDKLNKQMNLGNMSSGIYLLRIIAADNSKTIKFTIQ